MRIDSVRADDSEPRDFQRERKKRATAESSVMSFFPGHSKPASLSRQIEQTTGRGAVSSRCSVRNMIVFLVSHAREGSLAREHSNRMLAFGCLSSALSAICIT